MLTHGARLKSRRPPGGPLAAIDQVEDPTRTPLWRRVRSLVLLAVLAAVLGVVLAAVIGSSTVLFVSLLDHAIG